MEISSIIHGSLVLEPAAHCWNFAKKFWGSNERRKSWILDPPTLSLVIFHPSISDHQLKLQFTWTVTISKCSKFFLTKWLLAEYHQSQRVTALDCHQSVVVCVRLQNLGSVRFAWQDFPQMMAWISRKWWREFARIVDYLTSSSTGVWKLPASRQLLAKTSTNSSFPYTYTDWAC